jgi:hypothetical protein
MTIADVLGDGDTDDRKLLPFECASQAIHGPCKPPMGVPAYCHRGP